MFGRMSQDTKGVGENPSGAINAVSIILMVVLALIDIFTTKPYTSPDVIVVNALLIGFTLLINGFRYFNK